MFVDPAGEAPFTVLHESLGGSPDWPVVAHEQQARRRPPAASAPSCAGSASWCPTWPTPGRRSASWPPSSTSTARTCRPGGERLDRALAAARRRRPDLGGTLDLLAPRLADPADELALRFQQLTGAVMAKGIEDTACYRWTRFVALNEVGGDPSRFGVSVAEFHAANAARQARWPATMTTLSTHDTKRGEDVRARLAVLSELPGEWAEALDRWRAAMPVPDPMFEHLMWQTVVGTWPIERDRLLAYLQKAAREANRATSWTDPDEAFEGALRAAVDRLYADPELHRRRRPRSRRGSPRTAGTTLSVRSWCSSPCPGVPDTYQGTELWDNSLVDPDNRRPVDFAARAELLRPARRRLAAAGRRQRRGQAARGEPGAAACAATTP